MKKLLVASLLLIGGSSLFGMWDDPNSGQYANQAPCDGSHVPSESRPACRSCFPAQLPAAPAKPSDSPRPQSPAIKVK